MGIVTTIEFANIYDMWAQGERIHTDLILHNLYINFD
jgi:hypothetical protein